VANQVIAPVSADGDVYFFSSQAVDLLADVSGWLPAAGGFTAVSPDRVFDTAYPCGARNGVSNLNFVPGQTVANAVIAPVSSSGRVRIFSSQDVDLIADTNGWFPAAALP
jgi:hypothetical protein